MKKWIFISLLLTSKYIYAHHSGHSGTDRNFNIQSAGKTVLLDSNFYLFLNSEMQKGSRGNRDVLTSSFFLEGFFYSGRISFNLQVPHLYYNQKNKGNAGRMGKVYVGSKFFFSDRKTSLYFFYIENRVGFPSGENVERFAGGNYYLLETSLTAGKNWEFMGISANLGGIFPDRKDLTVEYKNEESYLPYFLQKSYEPERSEYSLKKAGFASLSLSFTLFSGLFFYSGLMLRTPYNGTEVLKEKDSDDILFASYKNHTGDILSSIYTEFMKDLEVKKKDTLNSLYYSEPNNYTIKDPSLYREVFGGIYYSISENAGFQIFARYPLERRKLHRLFDIAYGLAVLYRF
ncbi:MAG: hypothetical protein H7A25_09070 [Leptospiraceae bacterium]|nr:hypothetical protein [Leptospiraceae bacterium]